MLSRDEIQTALGAGRAVPLNLKNPHGPLGLEQLAATVGQLVEQRSAATNHIQRSISLPLETWKKLSDLANKLTQSASKQVTASDVATSLVVQAVDTVEQQ
ncbi:MAG: hypothetical protein O3C40_33090 [Planctomycetota bacterium]|nr:hypothetical protein [Planctomycetota bacterium]